MVKNGSAFYGLAHSQRVQKAIESTYFGKCTVIEYQKVKNEDKSIGFKEVVVLENQPCKLSFESTSAINPTLMASVVTKRAKLFISPNIKILSGSKIVVVQNFETVEYKNSGEPTKYSTHQEIMLEIFERWS